MNKTLEQWGLIDAKLCASNNSVAENQYLISDAKQDIAILGSELSRLRTELEELRAKLEIEQKDADRYRWLRDKSESINQFYLSVPLWFTGVRFRKEDVDAGIDASTASPATINQQGEGE